MGNILVDVSHPAHFHFFRPAIDLWREEGHTVTIAARDKDVTLQLLDAHGYDYHLLSRARRGLVGLARELLEHESRLLRLIRRTRPDVILEVAGTFIVHAAALARVPALVFYDTEHARLQNAITYPFATRIFTPAAYEGDLGPKQVRYDGYQELAYLHPRYFQPDASVLKRAELRHGERFFFLRFVSWEASHDLGHNGFSTTDKLRLVELLATHGRVLISSEKPLPPTLARYRVQVAPHLVHHLLAFAHLYVGESATMASEAAILGTPALYVSSSPRGYITEQQEHYQLAAWYTRAEEALARATELARDASAGQRFTEHRARLLADKVDVTALIREQANAYLAPLDAHGSAHYAGREASTASPERPQPAPEKV